MEEEAREATPGRVRLPLRARAPERVSPGEQEEAEEEEEEEDPRPSSESLALH